MNSLPCNVHYKTADPRLVPGVVLNKFTGTLSTEHEVCTVVRANKHSSPSRTSLGIL